MVVLVDAGEDYANSLLVLVLEIITLVVVSLKLPMCLSNLPWWLVFYIFCVLCLRHLLAQ